MIDTSNLKLAQHTQAPDIAARKRESVARNLRNFGFALCAFAIVGGVATMAGWALKLPRLSDWINVGIPMFGNTALAATCAGIGIFLRLRAVPSQRRAAQILGAFVTLLGGLTLLEHLFDINLGIDTLIFPMEATTRAAVAPSRMGPPASASFFLLGLGILLASSRPNLRVGAPLLSISVVAIATLGIVGYLFRADPLYATARITGIALQTATILAALGLALVIATPDIEPMATICSESSAGWLVRRALPWIIALPIILGWFYITGRRHDFIDRGLGTAALVFF